ncbi:hypothetical protein [Nocardioides ultimimeridianus]
MNSTTDEGGGPHLDPWPAYLPHREIDSAMARLESGEELSADEAARLIRLVTEEARRLREHTARLTTEKLAAAERKASGIVAAAADEAESMRTAGLTVLNARLEEAEKLIAAVRETCRP